jgi:hypothetical protein
MVSHRRNRSASGSGGTTVALLATVLAGAACGTLVLAPIAAGASDGAPVLGIAEQAPFGSGVTDVDVAATGHVAKELGEPAGLVPAGSDQASFEITVERIGVQAGCPGRGVSVAPSRGYFVVVRVRASLDDVSDLPGTPDDPYMPLVADAFHVLGVDGTPQGGRTEASWSCFEHGALAAPFLGPGETTAGTVVLDSAVPAGTLVYAPVAGGRGWQWPFPGAVAP